MSVTVESLEIEIGYSANNAADQIDKLTQALSRLKTKLGQDELSGFSSQLKTMNSAISSLSNSGIKKVSKLADALERIAKATQGINRGALSAVSGASGGSSGTNPSGVIPGGSAIRPGGDDSGEVEVVTKAVEKQTSAWDELKKRIADSTKGLRKFANAFMRIAFYRLIRSVIKAITDGLKEGLSNAYQFSTQVGFRLSESMDSVSSAALKMKNQLGSLAAEVISTVAPILIRLANIVTKIADAMAQFMAALQGYGTYLKAKDVTKPWEEGTKAAKKYKDNIQGFDELNIIKSDDDSGSGASGIGEMFEVAEVSSKIQKFVKWLKDHLKEILTIVGAIGAGIAAWKIGSLFTSDLKKLSGAFLTAAGAILYFTSAIDAWSNGTSWSNVIGMIAGAGMAALGLLLLFNGLTAGIWLLVAAVGMLVVGFRDWIKTGELSNSTFTLLETGFGILLVSVFGMYAGIAMVVIGIIKYWDEIKEFLGPVADWIDAYIVKPIKEKVGVIITAISKIVKKIKEMVGKVKEIFDALWPYIKLAADTVINERLVKLKKFVEDIKRILSPITKFFEKVATTIAAFFDKTISSAINAVFAMIENQINIFIDALNAVVDIVNTLPGVDISYVERLELPRLAKGGITQGATPALIGEAGREAVLPLDNNTGWMDKLAEKVSQNIVVQFEVEGDPNGLFKVTQKQAQQYKRRTGQSAFA